MKANHNYLQAQSKTLIVVVNISSSKNESKSQLKSGDVVKIEVVVNISSSKNESKSQQPTGTINTIKGCCKYQ